MIRKKMSVVAAAFLAAGLSIAASARAAVATSVEFSEVPESNGTALAGSDDFAAYGLHFDGSATYISDGRFVGAGTDTSGITTGVSSPIMTVLFDDGATSVTFDALSINTDFFATAYDADGDELDSFSTPVQSGTAYFSDTLLGTLDDPIARIDFHDNNQFIGVGRLDFTPAPEPTALGLIGLGAATMLRRRKIN